MPGCKTMAYQFTEVHNHPRGKVHEVQVEGKNVAILFTRHVLRRLAQWRLTDDLVYGPCFSLKRCSAVIMGVLLPISAEGNILLG